jgi:hypothetical protein
LRACAATSSASGASASRALPWTLSGVRLKTTFGIAHQTSANAAPSSSSRSDGSVSHTNIVSKPAKILEEHPAVEDLDLIDRTVRQPDDRWPDPRPTRERFFRREGDLWVLAVVDFEDVPDELVATLRDGRRLRIDRDDIAELLD